MMKHNAEEEVTASVCKRENNAGGGAVAHLGNFDV